MSLCERCIHNTATDIDLVVEIDAKTGEVLIPPHCALGMPGFPHAKECNAFYEVPIDGD
jgi:hypothetical protein